MFGKKTKPLIGLCAENETGYWFQTTMLNRYRLLAIPEKPVSNPNPNMENTLERIAKCRYKTKMDKRSGFWQVDLTAAAQELLAL